MFNKRTIKLSAYRCNCNLKLFAYRFDRNITDAKQCFIAFSSIERIQNVANIYICIYRIDTMTWVQFTTQKSRLIFVYSCVELIECFVFQQKGDTALHISVRSRYSGLCEVLLRDQKNSRLLYKPNKAGDTPYSIDRAHKQSVLSPIFGNSKLFSSF